MNGFLSLALVACLCACSPAAPHRKAPVLVGRATDVIDLDPARITDAESAEVAEQIFDHLVCYRNNSTDVAPGLAVRWEVSQDGRAWTFHLRPRVRFHDGTAVDADAVIFSFERQRDPHHPYYSSTFTYWQSVFRNIQSIDKLDSLTVRISIERSYAPFLANLAMFPVSIVSPTAVKKWGSEFGHHPVGSGPFRFVEWVPGDRVTLSRNSDYWDGAPEIENLAFVAIRDPRQRLVALEGGAIDVAENLSPQDLQFIALHPELDLYRVAGNNVGYLAINVQHPPFDSVLVRRAVNYAINKTAIVKLIYQGLAEPASTAVPPSLWGHVDEPVYAYDKQIAKRLLAEAHYVQPAVRPRLYAMDTARLYLPAPETVARIIQRNLHDVGIDVDVVTQSFNAHMRAVQNGEHDLCLLGWSADNSDPDNFLYVLFDQDNAQLGTARNVSFYRNPELHGVLVWAQESSDRKERERYYQRAQDIIARDAPWVPLAHAQVMVAARTSLQGLVVHPSTTLYFDRVKRR